MPDTPPEAPAPPAHGIQLAAGPYTLPAGQEKYYCYATTLKEAASVAALSIGLAPLGVIGIGPRCTYDLKSILALPDVQCVAICDVQASRREAGKTLVDRHYGHADCKLFRDFRELLARKDIDAVLIATGDRWHAPASMLAAQAGKDVYSEKPCGLTIAACQSLADTMKRTGRVFQAGTPDGSENASSDTGRCVAAIRAAC